MKPFKQIILGVLIGSIFGVCTPYMTPFFEPSEIDMQMIEPLTTEEIEKIREIIK